MTPRDALAEALKNMTSPMRSMIGRAGTVNMAWWEREADAILAASPRLASALELGLAWLDVVDVLPPDHVYFGLTHPNPTGTWWASVHGPTVTERCDHGVDHEAYPRENGYATTPTAALRALHDRLQSLKGRG